MKTRHIEEQFLGVIPVLTTIAGSCLTGDNWRESGVEAVSYHLASLLCKPGLEFLSKLPNLAQYVDWRGTLILNASFMGAHKQGMYTLRSPYDGSRLQYSLEAILAIIAQLKPQIAILPPGISSQITLVEQLLPETIVPFFSKADLPENEERAYGVYFNYDQNTSISALLDDLLQYQHLPRYVAGDLSPSLMSELVANGVRFIETDKPAADAFIGAVYTPEGSISLVNDEQANNFELINPSCQCLTCAQKFTRAYLHHLLAQTPLLCQRFLIQHNVYYANQFLHSQIA